MSRYVPKRPRDNGSGGISLFPFLAVLLCTMGALIMLLVVVARNVREQTGVVMAAVPEVVAPIEPEIDPNRMTAEKAAELLTFAQLECEDAGWMAENLTLSQKEKAETLEETRERLTALEQQNLKIKEELERLAQLATQMDQADELLNPAELQKLLAEKQEQAQKIEAELKLLQAEIERGKKSYAIIPYRGENGTFRRPIYLECEKDRVIIQPEGVVLDERDFLLENRAENPMDVALRVIRQYYLENKQIVRGIEPYPLLIVRPSGVNMYGTVQQSFGNWVQEYGYELVDEDWIMDYPEPSEELRQRLEKQLQVSRSRVQGYLEALAMQQNAQRGGVSGGERGSTAFRFNNRGVAQPVGRPQLYEGGPLPTHEPQSEPRMPKQAGPSASVPGAETQTVHSQNPNTNVPLKPQGHLGLGQMQGGQNNGKAQNWALKNIQPFSAAVTRKVKIQCEADRFVLIPQAGLATARTIPIQGSTMQAAEQLVLAIQDFMESWDMAGDKMYWKPVLNVTVKPGGEQRFRELERMLQGSGLEIEP